MSKWSECAHASGVWRVCARALWLTLHSHGASASTLDGGRVWSVVLTQLFKHQRRRQPIRSPHANTQSRSCNTREVCDWLLRCNYDGASAPRFRHALRQALTPRVNAAWATARAHTHVTHRMRVRTQITWTWLCTRSKKQYKYCSFSHTNRSFRVLGHQCVVTMGNCLIWISLCMFFFPLIETVTYTCHYMTDRLEPFDLKTSKLDLLKKKRHLHLGCPWGKLIDTKF